MGLLDKWVQKATSSLKDYVGSQSTGMVPGSTTTDPSLVAANRNYLVVIKQDQDVPTVPGMGGQPMVVVGQIAQEFQIDQAVKWATPWGAGLIGDGMVADIMAATSGNRLVAQVTTLQVWQGAGNDIDFTVSFELRAHSDTSRDVMIPLQYLLAMSMPSLNDAGFLLSPGPIIDSKALEELGQAIPKAISVAASDVGTIGGELLTAGKNAIMGKTSDGANSALAVLTGKSQGVQQLAKDIGTIAKKDTLETKMKNKISINIGQWFSLNNIVITNVQHTIKPQMPGKDGGLMAADVTIGFRPMFALTTADISNILRLPNQTSLAAAVPSAQGT
jgi:hypothetical protein